MQELLRSLPSVDACLTALDEVLPSAEDVPHALRRDLVRSFLDGKREAVRRGEVTECGFLVLESILPELAACVAAGGRSRLRRVLNATGVVIHTNLGRSVLAEEAREAVAVAAGNYCNLEFDLAAGKRGSRHDLIKDLLLALTGAEDALVVNNNAAAVYLMLNTLAREGEVLVSRGQLVEIGGSFRIPDVMAASGAVLREVGTTNRTHASDYEDAIGDGTRALLRVHTSNYRIVGFHAEVEQEDLARLAHAHDIPCLVDLGSGSLVDFSPWGLGGEPTVRDVIRAGADVVTFSGDKVLGGPQAGIIAGKAEYIRRIAKNQMLRALRSDKLTLAALEATLRLYLDPAKALEKVPTLKAMTMSPEELARRASRLARMIRRHIAKGQAGPPSYGTAVRVSVRPGTSRVGGGSFPERELPTSLVRLEWNTANPEQGLGVAPASAQEARSRLLKTDPPLVGRLEDDCLLLDPRTLHEADFRDAARVVAGLFLGAAGRQASPGV